MGNLRIKAQEILKQNKQNEDKELREREKSLKKLIDNEKSTSKEIFTEKIKKEIEDFQFNLLKSAEKGETLKIDILEISKELLLENSNNSSIKSLTTYLPISQKTVTFLSDTNFDLVSDDIIIDETLQSLYNLIRDNDIYPQWKVRYSKKDKDTTILYLEVNPLVGYREKDAEIKEKMEARKRIEQHALVLYTQNIKEMENRNKKSRIINFLFVFFSTLYISVVILTVLSAAVGISPIEEIINSFGLVAIVWPYYLFVKKSMFILSLPIGIILSSVFAFRRS